jgi:hypothetical protein
MISFVIVAPLVKKINHLIRDFKISICFLRQTP